MTYGLRGNANDQYGRSFSLDSNTNVVSTPFNSSQSSVSLDVAQPLLKNFWIDSTRLSITVSKIGVKQSDLGLKSYIIDLVTRVETAYYLLEFQIENVKVQQKALELAQRLLAENKKRVEVGALAPLDEKQAEAEVAARQADLIGAQNALRNAENSFKSIFSDNFASWRTRTLELVPSPSAERQLFNVQDSWARAFETQPGYLAAKLELEKQGVQLKFDRNQIYPQLDLVASYGYNGSGQEFSDSLDQTKSRDLPFYSYGGRLVIPLGNGTARNRHKSSKAVYEQKLLDLKSREQSIMVGIENGINTAQANYEQIEATRKAREYAEAALAAEQKKLENGKSTSFVVLSLQRDLTQALSNEINAIAQYKISLAQFAQTEGTTLERRKIDLTVK
jgi:outer membrane protein